MKVGVFGGTFDPPHIGHLAAARAARDALKLDRVELIPSNVPPHRRRPSASAENRMAMVTLAVAGEARLVPSAREIRRGGVSYTFETLEELAEEDPVAEIFLILGADAYDELPSWRAADLLARLAHWIVLPRPGGRGAAALRPADEVRRRNPADPPPEGKAVYDVDMVPVAIAAREVREQLSRGDDPGEVLPSAVFEYIRRRGLYGWPFPPAAHS